MSKKKNVETTGIPKENMKFASSSGKHGWESGLTILKSIEVVIPWKIVTACRSIANQVDGNEFSIITDIEKKEENQIFLKEDFYIPPQKVSVGSINYGPDARGGQVVIHRHPDNCNQFSTTDEEYINQNFKLSLLYTVKDGFIGGIYNMKTYEDPDVLVRVPVRISVEYDLPDVDITNIEIEKPYSSRNYNNNYSYPAYNNRTNWDTKNDLLEEDYYYDYGNYKYPEEKKEETPAQNSPSSKNNKYWNSIEEVKEDATSEKTETEEKELEKTQPSLSEVNNAILEELKEKEESVTVKVS